MCLRTRHYIWMACDTERHCIFTALLFAESDMLSARTRYQPILRVLGIRP